MGYRGLRPVVAEVKTGAVQRAFAARCDEAFRSWLGCETWLKRIVQPCFFPDGFNARDAAESDQRGYFGQAIVELPSGARVKVCFYDPVRLAQDLETVQESGGV